MLFRLRGRFRVSVPSLSQCPSRAGCGVDRMLFRRGDGSFLPGACFDGGDRNECARRTTALFGRNESPDGAGRFREAWGNAGCRRNRKKSASNLRGALS